MEPPNKGHIGDNINSAVLSFIERLSSYTFNLVCVYIINQIWIVGLQSVISMQSYRV